MASAMAANATAVHSVRSNRATNIAPSTMNTDRSRGPHNTGMGKSFGGSKASWNSNIWGDSNLGGGFADDHHGGDNAFEGKSGSGSLLSTSESDGWSGRPNMPWSTVNSTSSLSMAQTKTMSTSPVQSRANDRSAPALTESADTTSYFTLPRSSGIGGSSGSAGHKSYLNSGPDGLSSTDAISFGSFGSFKNGEPRRQMSSAAFAGSPRGSTFPLNSGFPGKLETPRTEEVISSIAMRNLHPGVAETVSQMQARGPYTHLSHNSASFTAQRPAHSAHPSFHSENHGFESRYTNGQVDINAGLNKLQLNEGNFTVQQVAQRPGYLPHGSYDGPANLILTS